MEGGGGPGGKDVLDKEYVLKRLGGVCVGSVCAPRGWGLKSFGSGCAAEGGGGCFGGGAYHPCWAVTAGGPVAPWCEGDEGWRGRAWGGRRGRFCMCEGGKLGSGRAEGQCALIHSACGPSDLCAPPTHSNIPADSGWVDRGWQGRYCVCKCGMRVGRKLKVCVRVGEG